MASCDRCDGDVFQRFVIDVYHANDVAPDRADVCLECYSNVKGTLPDNIQALPDSFYLRTFQGGIAGVIARALFQHFDYEVHRYGYEDTVPQWLTKLNAGDPNSVAAKIKCTPDLRVYDPQLNNAYEVEIKTMKQAASQWRPRKYVIDNQRHYHPDVIYMVYVQQSNEFYVKAAQQINWGNIPTRLEKYGEVYVVDLTRSFLKPPKVFNKMSINDYYPLLKSLMNTLGGF